MTAIAARLLPTIQLDVNVAFYTDAGSCGTRDCRGTSIDYPIGGIDTGQYLNDTQTPQTVFIVVDSPQSSPAGTFTLETELYPASSAGDTCTAPVALGNPSTTTQNLWLASDTESTSVGYCVFTAGPNRFYQIPLPPRTETVINTTPLDGFLIYVSLISGVGQCGLGNCLPGNSVRGMATIQNTANTAGSVIVAIESPFLPQDRIPVFQLDILNTPLP